MKRLLLVIPSSTYRTHDFMAAAEKTGVEITVATDHHPAMAALVPDTTIALNFRKPAAIGEKAIEFLEKKLSQKFPFKNPAFDAIIGVDDTSVYAAAMIAQALGLPHNSPTAVKAARNKLFMRQKLVAAGLNCPKFQVFSTSENPQHLSQKMDYPGVLKPTFLSASRGVTRADTPAQFITAFQEIRRLLENPEVAAKAYDEEAKQILVEDYIPGVEVAIEGILINREFKALAIFDKPDPLEGPHFVETIYVTPSRLPAYVQREAIFAAQQSALALGLENGPIHAEIRINEKGAWVVETAARSIGGLCSRVLRFDEGISLEELILRQAIGENIFAIQREKSAAGVMMIPIPRAGILKEIKGIEMAKTVSDIEDIIITIPTGQEVIPMPIGGRYLGFIFARNSYPGEVESAIRRAFKKLEIIID